MSLSKYSDDLIVKSIKENDSVSCNDVLKFMYKQFFPAISKFVISNNGNKTEAQDIFQEAIITFYEKIKKENLNLTCSVMTYLYSVSRNLWLKRLSKVNKLDYDINDFEEFIDVDYKIDADFQNEESGKSDEILVKLIGKLDAGCRQILSYYYYDKLTMNIIKDKMNLGSEQSAKNKKYKCMKHLMELIKNNKKLNETLTENYFV